MSHFSPIEMTSSKVLDLRDWLLSQQGFFPVDSEDAFLLISYCLSKELGGVNDQLAKFILDEENETSIEIAKLRAEIGIFEGHHCIRIFSKSFERLTIKIPQLKEILICRGDDLIISPADISEKIRAQGLMPVVVRDWLRRAIFSEFDPQKMSYRDQLWVLRNNEVMQYAYLVASKKIIFQDMHDITAHVAGLRSSGYEFASGIAGRVYQELKLYFGPAGRGNLPSHLLPFLMGIILDGLTQSMIYGSEPRRTTIDVLLNSMKKLEIDPQAKLKLKGFPKGIDIINGFFQNNAAFSIDRLKVEIELLLEECHRLSS
jgi:hypothetical protein